MSRRRKFAILLAVGLTVSLLLSFLYVGNVADLGQRRDELLWDLKLLFVPNPILLILNPHILTGDVWAIVGLIVGLAIVFPVVCEFAFPSGQADTIARSNVHGTASWSNEKDIKRYGLYGAEGVFLGCGKGGRYLRHHGPEHYAVVAPSRSGKGAGIVVPTLLTWPGSVIVHDVKEENWNITAGRRSEFSKVIRFSPTTTDSARFNPLREVRLGKYEVRDVQNIADMIVDPDGTGHSDHWTKTGHSLLVATILHVLYTGEKSEQNLAGVARFLSQTEKNLNQTLKEMKNMSHIRDDQGRPLGPHPTVAAAARDMLNKADNERSGVLSTAMSFLNLYRDPIVAWNTSESDFCVEDLIKGEKPVSLYMVIPPSDIPRLKPLTRLVVNQFCRRLTEELNPQNQKHKLLLMLDEFPLLGRLEFFETAMGFLAGYGIKCMLVCQCINQLRKIYGTNNSILDHTHVRVFYAPNTIETAEYVSKCLGSGTVEFESSSKTSRFASLIYNSRNVSNNLVGRPLLTPTELMVLDQTKSIVFAGNNSPILAEKIRYYQDQSFLDLLKDAPQSANNFNCTDGKGFWRDRLGPVPKTTDDESDESYLLVQDMSDPSDEQMTSAPEQRVDDAADVF